MKNKAPSVLIAITAMTFPLHAATTVFSDNFSDNNRDGWLFFTNGTTTASAATGALVMNATPSNNGAVITYFSPVNLALGQSLVLTFQVRSSNATNGTASALRFGVFDSAGTQINADQTVTNNTAFRDDTGYAAFHSFSNTSTTQTVNRRLDDNSNTFWTGGAYSALDSASGASGNNVNDTFYTATLTLDYISLTNMTATSNFGSATRSGTHNDPITTFDAISVFTDGATGTITIDNVSLTLIPEPTTALLGALASLTLLRRRR